MQTISDLKLREVLKILVTLLFLFISLVAWAFSSPVGSSPDDNYHLPSIWCAETSFNPECKHSESSYEVPSGLVAEQCFAFKPSISGDCSAVELTKRNYDNIEHINNVEHGYPDVFYKFHSFLKSENLQIFNLKVRLANSLIFVTSLGLLLFLLRDLMKWRKTLFLLTIQFIPLGFFLIPSVNPSSWVLIFLPCYWLCLRHLATNGKKVNHKSFYLVFIFFWIGLNFSRADGSIYSLIGTACVLPFISNKRETLREKYFLLVGLLSILSVYNFLRLATPGQVISGEMNANKIADSGQSLQLLASNIQQIYYFFLGGTGRTGLGWLDTYVPNYVWKIMSVMIVLIFMLSVYELGRNRKFNVLFSTLFALFAYLFIPILILQSSAVQIGGMLQPRYMLPLLSLVLLIPIMEVKMTSADESRYFLALSPLLVLTFAASLGSNIQRYSTNLNSPFSLDAYSYSKWSMFGWHPLHLFLFGSVAFMMFLWCLVSLGRSENAKVD